MIEVVRKLNLDEQLQVLNACRSVVGQAPLFQKTMPTGQAFKYLCTSAGDYGWVSDRKGFRYIDTHPTTGFKFPPMPPIFHDIAVSTVKQCGLEIRPESALINWYDEKGTLGCIKIKPKSAALLL